MYMQDSPSKGGFPSFSLSGSVGLSCVETQVEIIDSIRGKDVFIIQTGYSSSESTSTNDSIMEMLIMCYACKTSSARRVIGEC